MFISLFLLTKKAQKKKLGKKKYAVKGVSFPAGNDQGFAFGNHNLFEKRLIKNFHMGVVRALKLGKIFCKGAFFVVFSPFSYKNRASKAAKFENIIQ